MDTKTIGWLGALCLGLVAWLYYDVSSVEINYQLNSFLINDTSGEKMRPIDVVDLSEVIRPSREYVNKTNAMERLFHMAQQMSYENGIAIQYHYSDPRELEQSGWPVANRTRCGLELDWIRDQLGAAGNDHALLAGNTGQELTQLLDSFGKPEAGFYAGKLTWPGSYDLCRKASLNEGAMRTRYCLAMMRFRWWPAREFGIHKTRVKIGICIPETCDTSAANSSSARDKIDALTKLGMNEFARENLILESVFCLPDERSPIRQIPPTGRLFLAALGAWLVLIVTASIVTRIASAKRRIQLSGELPPVGKEQLAAHKNLLASGLVKADTAFVVGPQEPQTGARVFRSNPFEQMRKRALAEGTKVRVDLAQANFYKFLMANAVVLLHAFVFVNFHSTSLSHRLDISLGTPFYLAANLTKIVDTFFVLVGILSAYTLLRKFSVEQLASPLVWLAIQCGILARLSPIYLLTYWYSKLVEPYTGAGPRWEYGTFNASIKGECMRQPWWRVIPYFSTMGGLPAASCVPAAWFLVALVQISLVLPLVIYLFYKLRNNLSKCLLLAFITLISSLQIILKVHGQTSIKGEIFGTHGALLLSLTERFESMGGMAGIGRLSCVVYGCYVGYLLHLYETGAVKKWPRWLTSVSSLALIVLCHVLVLAIPFGGYLYLSHSGRATTLNNYLAGYIFGMIIWPLLNGMLAINLVSVYDHTRLCRALGHPFWHTANKLGLAMFLLHWNVLVYLSGSYQGGASEGHITDAFKLGCCSLIFTLLLSFPVVILLDTPVTTLLTMLITHIIRAQAVRAEEASSNHQKSQKDPTVFPLNVITEE